MLKVLKVEKVWESVQIVDHQIKKWLSIYLERAFPVQSKRADIFWREVKVRRLCPKFWCTSWRGRRIWWRRMRPCPRPLPTRPSCSRSCRSLHTVREFPVFFRKQNIKKNLRGINLWPFINAYFKQLTKWSLTRTFELSNCWSSIFCPIIRIFFDIWPQWTKLMCFIIIILRSSVFILTLWTCECAFSPLIAVQVPACGFPYSGSF